MEEEEEMVTEKYLKNKFDFINIFYIRLELS